MVAVRRLPLSSPKKVVEPLCPIRCFLTESADSISGEGACRPSSSVVHRTKPATRRARGGRPPEAPRTHAPELILRLAGEQEQLELVLVKAVGQRTQRDCVCSRGARTTTARGMAG